MATTHKGGPGRKSKGKRHALLTRLRQALADDVMQEADAREVSYSDYLWEMAEFVHGDPELHEAFLRRLPPIKNESSVQAKLALDYHASDLRSA